MELLRQLLEMSPRRIDPTDFGLDNELENKSYGRQLVSRGAIPIKKHGDDYTLYEIDRGYVLMKNDTKEIVYQMEYRQQFFPGINRKAVRQIKVWRNLLVTETQNLSKDIFFNTLLYNFKTIITDSEQTEAGEAFWKNRIGEVLSDSKCYIYFADIQHPRQVVKINNRQDYVKYRDLAYGDSKQYQSKKFVITTDPLDEFGS